MRPRDGSGTINIIAVIGTWGCQAVISWRRSSITTSSSHPGATAHRTHGASSASWRAVGTSPAITTTTWGITTSSARAKPRRRTSMTIHAGIARGRVSSQIWTIRSGRWRQCRFIPESSGGHSVPVRTAVGHGKVVWLLRSCVERRAIIITLTRIGTECRKRRAIGGRRTDKRFFCIRVHGLRFGITQGDRGCILAIVIVFATHLSVLRDTPLPCLATDQGATHSASHDTTRDEDYGGSQHNPTAPSKMWDKEEDIHQKRKQSDKQGWQK